MMKEWKISRRAVLFLALTYLCGFGLMVLSLPPTAMAASSSAIVPPSQFDAEYKKLLSEYLRIHTLFLQERLKNEKGSANGKAEMEINPVYAEYKILIAEFLRIHKLYLEERLKNEKLAARAAEVNDIQKELDNETKYCEKDTSNMDREIEVLSNKLEKKEEEVSALEQKLADQQAKCAGKKPEEQSPRKEKRM